MFEYRVKLSFAAAHKIDGHLGKCANLHGHNWDVEIHVVAEELNELGIGMDFSDIKRIANTVVDQLDHIYLNDMPYFQTCPPTAEHVAKYIFEQTEKFYAQGGVRLVRVTIWETNGYGVSYQK